MSSPSFHNNREANRYYHDACSLIKESSYLNAISFLNKALQYNPSQGQYFKDRSFCLFQLATSESINYQYQQYLEKHDLDNYYLLPTFETYFNLCNLDDSSFQVAYTNNSIPSKFVDYIKHNLLLDAVSDSLIAISLEETDVDAYGQLVDLYKELGDYQQSFIYLLKATKYELRNQIDDVFPYLENSFRTICNQYDSSKEQLEKQVAQLERKAKILQEQISNSELEIERLERKTQSLNQKLSSMLHS